MNTKIEPHNIRAQAMWNSPAGRYNEISRSIADAIEHAVERLHPQTGERILDLATGTGWCSRVLAERFPGVKIIGADIAEKMLDYASMVASTHKLAIEYRQGDAERLPFADGEFDAVVSTFGVMFASKPEAAAAEISRVVKANGRVVLASWKPESNVFHMFGVMKKYMPPAQPSTQAAPSPFEWGRMERIKALLEAKFDLRFEDGTNHFRYASGIDAWNLWVNHYGPTKTLAENLDDEKREQFKMDMIRWHETFGSNLGYDQPRDYLITQGKRRLA